MEDHSFLRNLITKRHVYILLNENKTFVESINANLTLLSSDAFTSSSRNLYTHTDNRPSNIRETCSIYTTISLYIFSSVLNQYSNNRLKVFWFSRSMATNNNEPQFHDFLPLMADKLGGDGLIDEMCKGFDLLMDRDKGVITFDSLKKNSSLLGLQDLSDNDLLSMLREGDFDGDGALSQMEFCVLMFRLSPELMEQSEFLLEQALEEEFNNFQY